MIAALSQRTSTVSQVKIVAASVSVSVSCERLCEYCRVAPTDLLPAMTEQSRRLK